MRGSRARFFVVDQHPWVTATLSLWDDLESIYRFAYNGRNGVALSNRKDWFRKPEWST